MATKSAFAKAAATTALLRRSSPSTALSPSMKILSSSAATAGRDGVASDPNSSSSNSNSSIVNSKRFFGFYATVPKLEKKIMKVPTMGDSITEGTIVEWTVEIGQAVSDGDVVALVETDKVTVEIKAQVNGVITQRFGAVDETVEVGANLYELDTEGTATFDAAATSTSVSSTPPEAPSAAVPAVAPVVAVNGAVTAAASSDHHRLPSIKFLGKQGWEAARKGHAIAEQQPPKSVVAGKPNAVTTLFDNTILHPMYGRPRFTDAEIEALLTGGATLAPSILMHSGGAKFK